MISRIVLSRLEPCFRANKPVYGELARVKKNGENPNPSTDILKANGVDTFTSSKTKSAEEEGKISEDKASKK